MRPVVVTPPPNLLGLDTVKAHLRLEGSDDDAYLAGLMAVAQGAIDGPAGWLGTSIGPQTLELRATDFGTLCGEGVPLPYGPVTGLVSVRFVAPDGALGTVDPSDYALADDALVTAPSRSWPAMAARPDAVRIRYTAGYPDTPGGTPVSTVPAPIVQAMLVMVAILYENRIGDADFETNRTVAGLLRPFRRWGA